MPGNEPKRLSFEIDFHGGGKTVFEVFRTEKLARFFNDHEISLADWLNALCDEYDKTNPPPDGWEKHEPVLSIEVWQNVETASYRITSIPHPLLNLEEVIGAISVAVVDMYIEKRDEFTREEFRDLVVGMIEENLLTAREKSDDPNVVDLPVGARFKVIVDEKAKRPWWKRLFGKV